MKTTVIKATGERIESFTRDNQLIGSRWNPAKEDFDEFPLDKEQVIIVPTYYTKENEETLAKVRESLQEVGYAEVHNEYETFYGVGFDRWLREGLKDLDLTIEVTLINHWEGYPWTYFIKRNN